MRASEGRQERRLYRLTMYAVLFAGAAPILLPFYWQSATLMSAQAGFIGVVGACALLSTLDVVFDRFVMRWRVLASMFHAFILFGTLAPVAVLGFLLVGLRTLADVIGVSVGERLFDTVLLAGFAMLALVLASIGVYGLIAYSVVQRTREIGVRMAIGATSLDVLRLVVGQGARLAAAGVAMGLVGAFGASRLARTLLFGVSPADPATFAASALLLLAVGALASLAPALRASRIDPQEAIRAE